MAKSSPKPPQFVAPKPKGVVPALTREAQTEIESARFSTQAEGTTSRLTAEGRSRLSAMAANTRRTAVAPSELPELDLDAAVFDEDEGEDEDEPPTDLDVEQQVPTLAQDRARSIARINEPVFTETATVAPVPDITLQSVSDEDVDHLWDWLRSASDTGQSFLDMQLVKTSRQLTAVVNALADRHYFESIYFQGTKHLGFLALAPLERDLNAGVVHMYLRAEVRGQLADLVGPLLTALQLRTPPGLRLVVYSTDPALAKLHRTVLDPLGFTEHTLFVR